jgi:hypothetical protein
MDETEEFPGQKIVRTEEGKFAPGSKLSSEEASRRVAMRGKGVEKELEDIAESFLFAAGYNASNPASPMIRRTALECARGKSGFAANMKLFLEQTGQNRKDAPHKLLPGETCPYCGHVGGSSDFIDADAARELLARLRDEPSDAIPPQQETGHFPVTP